MIVSLNFFQNCFVESHINTLTRSNTFEPSQHRAAFVSDSLKYH